MATDLFSAAAPLQREQNASFPARLRRVEEAVTLLDEQLRYELSSLSERNFTQAARERLRSAVTDETGRVSSLLSQTAGELRAAVQELRGELESRYTELRQTAEDFTFTFYSALAEQEETADGLQELKSTIRLSDGAVELGRSDSDFTLRLTNDRISFRQSGTEVAYLSDNKLYITRAQILSGLRIGAFLLEESADGHFSLKKAVI